MEHKGGKVHLSDDEVRLCLLPVEFSERDASLNLKRLEGAIEEQREIMNSPEVMGDVWNTASQRAHNMSLLKFELIDVVAQVESDSGVAEFQRLVDTHQPDSN